MVFPIILVLLCAATILFCANNIDFWSAVVKLDAADSAPCTAAGGHALSWLLNYHLWWSRWLKAHPERQECVWEAPAGYKWHSDVTFPRMCFLCLAHERNMSLKSKLEYLSYLLAPGSAVCTTVDLSHSCRPIGISAPSIKHEAEHAWSENYSCTLTVHLKGLVCVSMCLCVDLCE